jgi:hypothetical protein
MTLAIALRARCVVRPIFAVSVIGSAGRLRLLLGRALSLGQPAAASRPQKERLRFNQDQFACDQLPTVRSPR